MKIFDLKENIINDWVNQNNIVGITLYEIKKSYWTCLKLFKKKKNRRGTS